MPKLYVRTEASPSIGMGHFMRCFAIAEAAHERGQSVTFLLDQVPPAILARLDAIGAAYACLTTAIGTTDDIEAIGETIGPDDVLIIDSYRVTSAYLEALCAVTKVVLIDDLCALEPMPCHMVINAAITARDMPYERLAPHTRRLIGADYAAIRHEFREVTPVTGDHIAIMLGGSDAKGLSLITAQAILEAVEKAEVHIIVGPALLDRKALMALQAAEPRVRIIDDPKSVAAALQDARIVVTAAGTSVAEIASMGLMALVMVIADNQVAHMTTCPYPVRDARNGLPDDMGTWVAGFYKDRPACDTIAENAKGIFDGQGCARILSEIDQL